jgi:SAM-dependent methyltransferase
MGAAEPMEAVEYALMDAAEQSMWWYRALHLRLLDALAEVRGSVLDAGCGTGGFLSRLVRDRQDLSVVGVDAFAPAAVRACEKSGRPAVCASLQNLPFADNTFDAVVSADVLCHQSLDPPLALAEIARVLRPGGRLILNLPAHEWLRSAHDAHVHTARRSTRRGVSRLLAASGYTQVRAAHWNSLLLPLMVVERKVLSRGPRATSAVRAFHPRIDDLFFRITEIERRLPSGFPLGGSVMATARLPYATQSTIGGYQP